MAAQLRSLFFSTNIGSPAGYAYAGSFFLPADCVQPPWLWKTSQLHGTAVFQLDPGRSSKQMLGAFREEYLSSRSVTRDPLRRVHGSPEQVFFFPDYFARVEPDLHADGPIRLGTGPLSHRTLDVDRAGDGPPCRRERHHQPVARALHLTAPMPLDLASHQFVAGAENLTRSFVPHAVRQFCGADDIREQDGDGTFRELSVQAYTLRSTQYWLTHEGKSKESAHNQDRSA